MRAEPSDELVNRLADRTRGPRKVYRGLRTGIAVALTVGLLGALAPIGAASYAGKAASNLVVAAARVVSANSHAIPSAKGTPASHQYKKPKKPKKHKKKPPKKKGAAAGQRARRGPHFTG
jgi:hypothetical protein